MQRPPRVAVIGTRYRDLSVEQEILAPLGAEVFAAPGGGPEELVAAAGDADVVLAGSRPRFTADVLERLRCRAIVRYGVGVEGVDLEAAARLGMWVANVPDYGTDAVATHAVALLLGLARRLHVADALVKRGEWGLQELRPLRALDALTVGVVGYGRIGQRVCELLAPFGCSLLVYDAQVAPPTDMAAPSLEALLEGSDAVTLHVPGSPDGRPLLGERELGLMRPGALLVNTARGSLVDTAALVEALRSGRLGGAALDVFESEPPGPVFSEVADRVLLSPHMAWYTEESERDLRSKAAREAERVLRGEPPLHPVAAPQAASKGADR